MFLQHFDHFCYYSNRYVHATAKKDVHNKHLATCSHTKFHQASWNSFELSKDPDFSRQTDREMDGLQ